MQTKLPDLWQHFCQPGQSMSQSQSSDLGYNSSVVGQDPGLVVNSPLLFTALFKGNNTLQTIY